MTHRVISTRQQYSLDLLDKDIFSFSFGSGGSQDSARFVIPASKFPDLDPVDDPVVRVRFASGEQLDFDIEDRQLDFSAGPTRFIVTGIPSSFRALDQTPNKTIVFATLLKEEHEAWQTTVEGRDRLTERFFDTTKPGCEYELKVRIKDLGQEPWTNKSVLEWLCDNLYGWSTCITAYERELDAPYMVRWFGNLKAVVSNLFGDTYFNVSYDSINERLTVEDVYDEAANHFSMTKPPNVSIKESHPAITEDATFELEGGLVDFRADKYQDKWGETFTTPLDPRSADLKPQNSYIRALLYGTIPWPEDFFTMGMNGTLAVEGNKKILDNVSAAAKKKMRSQWEDFNSFDHLGADAGATLARFTARSAWRATRPLYFYKLHQPDGILKHGSSGKSMAMTQEWVAGNSIGEVSGWSVFKRESLWHKDDHENPRNGEEYQEGWFLQQMSETVTFYEGIVPGVKMPRAVCSVTVTGAMRIELRPKGFTIGETVAKEKYHYWHAKYGDEYGHRAQFFNSTAAGKTAKNEGAELADKGWIPKQVWEPNAEMIMRAQLFDENDYPLYVITEKYGITYEDSGTEGNEKTDEASQTNPELWGPWDKLSGGKSPDDPSTWKGSGGMYSQPGDYKKGKGSTTGKSSEQKNADAVENSNKGMKHAIYELARINTKDEYSGISDSTFHWMLFTYGDSWTQDPACLVESSVEVYPSLSQTEMITKTYKAVLTNGFFITWEEDAQLPNNQLTKVPIVMIQHHCYYDVNFPIPDDVLDIVDAGLKAPDMAFVTDWPTIERAGERLREQALNGLANFTFGKPGSFALPHGMEVRFSTPQRTFQRHPGSEVLSAMSYETISGGYEISQEGPGTARVEFGARKKI